MSAPDIDVIIPTYNSTATLELTLRSLRQQRYEGRLRILCVDGGSTDHTIGLCAEFGAQVIPNPDRIQELGIPLGIESATAELVLVIDHDDELPHPEWLRRVVAALELADDVAGADCLYHTWRRQDYAFNRLFALMGGNDPIAIELGWSDRWAYHLQRWTGMPVEVENRPEALLVRVDPEQAPPIGSNGFLVRRAALLEVPYRPFVHPDVVAELAARGWRFARVKDSVIHHFVSDFPTLVRKVRARARRTANELDQRRQTPRLSPLRRLGIVLWSYTLVGPAVLALRGFVHRPDPAWALYVPLHVLWTTCYGLETLTAYAQRRRMRMIKGSSDHG